VPLHVLRLEVDIPGAVLEVNHLAPSERGRLSYCGTGKARHHHPALWKAMQQQVEGAASGRCQDSMSYADPLRDGGFQLPALRAVTPSEPNGSKHFRNAEVWSHPGNHSAPPAMAAEIMTHPFNYRPAAWVRSLPE